MIYIISKPCKNVSIVGERNDYYYEGDKLLITEHLHSEYREIYIFVSL